MRSDTAFRLLLVWMALLLLPDIACAAGVDITADKIVRNAKGVATASGKVEIKRKDETITADTVRYDAASHQIEARGNVVIRTPKAVVKARSAELNTISKQGVLHDATVTFPGGEHMSAKQLERVDEFTYKALQPSFSMCPADHGAWKICASSAVLDQKNGTFTARDARFEIAGVPVLYTPYWQQGNQRKSGLLLPKVSTGQRRGVELGLPYYFAPAPDWDATFTPLWMSKRGFRPKLELRHVSTIGREIVKGEVIRDKRAGGRIRNRLQARASWQLPDSMNLAINADHVSDYNYLADFSSNASEAATRFLISRATLSQQSEYGVSQLWVQHQQDLTQPSNDATLQIMPRFENRLAFPVLNRLAILHFDQQTTLFDRNIGSRGWRMDLHPYVKIPLELAGGGISTILTAGVRNTRYWLARNGSAAQRPTRTDGEFSVETHAIFERISADKTLRNTIEPILRYDLVNVTNQTGLPNFDSAFGRLTMSTLLSNDRFSGIDRIESVNRFSFLLASRLQSRSRKDHSTREIFNVRVGASYNIRKRLSDLALQTKPIRPFSNLLGELSVTPIPSLSFYAAGQYDPAGRFWDTATTSMNWNPASGHKLRVAYRVTDARFAPAAQTINVSGSVKLGPRWHTLGSWDYNTHLRITQHASLGLGYEHPCWHLTVEAYRINRPSGTSTASNFGVNFLLGIKGMGSLGKCAGQ